MKNFKNLIFFLCNCFFISNLIFSMDQNYGKSSLEAINTNDFANILEKSYGKLELYVGMDSLESIKKFEKEFKEERENLCKTAGKKSKDKIEAIGRLIKFQNYFKEHIKNIKIKFDARPGDASCEARALMEVVSSSLNNEYLEAAFWLSPIMGEYANSESNPKNQYGYYLPNDRNNMLSLIKNNHIEKKIQSSSRRLVTAETCFFLQNLSKEIPSIKNDAQLLQSLQIIAIDDYARKILFFYPMIKSFLLAARHYKIPIVLDVRCFSISKESSSILEYADIRYYFSIQNNQYCIVDKETLQPNSPALRYEAVSFSESVSFDLAKSIVKTNAQQKDAFNIEIKNNNAISNEYNTYFMKKLNSNEGLENNFNCFEEIILCDAAQHTVVGTTSKKGLNQNEILQQEDELRQFAYTYLGNEIAQEMQARFEYAKKMDIIFDDAKQKAPGLLYISHVYSGIVD